MKVREAYQKFSLDFDAVRSDAPIEEVFRSMQRRRTTRSVFVTDEEGKLLGVIGIEELLRFLGPRFVREAGFTRIKDVLASKARDIMSHASSVSLDDDLEEGLRVAVECHIGDVPVCEDGRLVGTLDAFEILNFAQEIMAGKKDG